MEEEERDERHCERGSVAGRGGGEVDGWRRDRLPTEEEALSSPLTGKKSEDARNPPLLALGPRQLLIRRLASAAVADLSTSGTAN